MSIILLSLGHERWLPVRINIFSRGAQFSISESPELIIICNKYRVELQ